MIIAIDGPAGSGKSTTARLLARRLGYLYLDTGAMYRAVALAAHRAGLSLDEEHIRTLLGRIELDVVVDDEGPRIFLNGEDVTAAIRAPEIGQLASLVSRLAPVREKLVAEQRKIARSVLERGGGVVLEGRDIGTVVFPDADLKIFLVADPRERARRRAKELEAQGLSQPEDEVLKEILQRDRQDQERPLAPLRKAPDAIELDTTRLTIDEQVDLILKMVRERQTRSEV